VCWQEQATKHGDVWQENEAAPFWDAHAQLLIWQWHASNANQPERHYVTRVAINLPVQSSDDIGEAATSICPKCLRQEFAMQAQCAFITHVNFTMK
jgi:hypothetical protein